MFTQLLASQPVRQKSAGGFTASAVLHVAVLTAVIAATHQTVQVIEPVIEQTVRYIEPEIPAPPKIEQPAAPSTPPSAEPVTGTIDIPVTIVKLADLPRVPVASTPIGESALAGMIRRGAPVVAVSGDPGGQIYSENQVESPVAITKDSPRPRYPAALASTGIIGDARFRFVVDSAGRVEMNTVEQVMSSHPAFAATVRATLPRMRFTPATFGGKPVRQLVELPFLFRAAK